MTNQEPGAPEPLTSEGGLRDAIESVIRCTEVIPLSNDVEQAGAQSEVVVVMLREILAALRRTTQPEPTE